MHIISRNINASSNFYASHKKNENRGMNIGSTLKMLRKQKGMSGKQLGRLAGCNQSTVSRKEAGEDCDEYLMMMFAQALGVQPSVF